MSLQLTLNTAGGDKINTNITDQDVINHFNNPINHAHVIIDQINNENLYNWFENKKDLVILDCGGNIGLFSLHVSDVAKKIVTVEPTPAHIKILKKFKKSKILWINLN